MAYVNQARPDYGGFVFAPSRRQVSYKQAAVLRARLAGGIMPVGVFVDAPLADLAALYKDGIIAMAQLHGREDEAYMAELKSLCGGEIPLIKTLILGRDSLEGASFPRGADYFLLDSGSGSGTAFNWDLLKGLTIPKPWFLAGGINLDNIEEAMACMPFAIDVSSGAETGGVKDGEKILRLVEKTRSSEGP